MSFKLLHIVAVASLTAGLSGLPSSVMAQVPPPSGQAATLTNAEQDQRTR